jgi:hypothetical protein
MKMCQFGSYVPVILRRFCCLLAVIGGFIVARWYKKEVKALAQNGTFSNNSKQQAQQQN